MNWYLTTKRYYDLGYWKLWQVAYVCQCGKITQSEFTQITGMAYSPELAIDPATQA